MGIRNLKKEVKNKKWRRGESNPVPLACEASALPYELHPHVCLVSLLWYINKITTMQCTIILTEPHLYHVKHNGCIYNLIFFF